MLVQEVAGKYAHALFMATRDKGLIDQAYEEFRGLKEFLGTDKSLLNFLGAPQVLVENKEKLIRDVFGGRMHQLFVEFLIVLLEKKRMSQLVPIVDDFIALLEAEKGIGRATVTTAKPLDDAQRDQLIKQLSAKSGLQIRLDAKVDPAVMGGMIVVMEGQILDGSVRHGLDQITERLGKIRVH